MADQLGSTVTIKASVAVVMATIADLSKYPSWSGLVEKVDILDTDAAGRPGRARFQVKSFVGKEEYVLAYTWVSAEQVAWTLVESTSIASLDGSYTLRDLGDGTTETRYELAVELKAKIPGIIRKKAEEGMVSAAMKDLKAQAER